MLCFDWRSQRPFMGWMAAYVVVVFATSFLVSPQLPLGLKIVLAILPMIPATGALFAWVTAFRRLDELQRQIQAESMLVSFGVTAIVTFGYGFLQQYAGAPLINMFFVWPLMAISWGVAAAFIAPRYR